MNWRQMGQVLSFMYCSSQKRKVKEKKNQYVQASRAPQKSTEEPFFPNYDNNLSWALYEPYQVLSSFK